MEQMKIRGFTPPGDIRPSSGDISPSSPRLDGKRKRTIDDTGEEAPLEGIDQSKRRKVENREPDHADQELIHRCQEMDKEDYQMVFDSAHNALRSLKRQLRKKLTSEESKLETLREVPKYEMLDKHFPDPLLAQQENIVSRLIHEDNEYNHIMTDIYIKKYSPKKSAAMKYTLRLIQESRDIKTGQGEKSIKDSQQQLVTVEAAEALEHAIWGLSKQCRNEAEQLKTRYEQLKDTNERLTRRYLISSINTFTISAQKCRRFYNVLIRQNDEMTKNAYSIYKSAKDGLDHGTIRLEHIQLEDGDSLSHDARILGGIHAEIADPGKLPSGRELKSHERSTHRTEFHFASPFTKENLWDEQNNRITLMAREAIQLLVSGYEIRNRDPKFNEGNAGVKSLKDYPYAVCVDAAKAKMASLPKFMNAVAQFHVKRKEGETQEEFKRRLETDENLKRRVTETKEALWKLLSSVLEKEEVEGVEMEDSPHSRPEDIDTGLSQVDTGLSQVDTGPSQVDTRPSQVDIGPSQVEKGKSKIGDTGAETTAEGQDPSQRRKVDKTREPDHAYQELKHRCQEMDKEDYQMVFDSAYDTLAARQEQVKTRFALERVQSFAQPLNAEIRVYDSAKAHFSGDEFRDDTFDKDVVVDKALRLIRESRDIKTGQGEKSIKYSQQQRVTVEAAEALEHAIWGLSKQYQDEAKRLRTKCEQLETENERLEAKNVISNIDNFVSSAQQCGKGYYVSSDALLYKSNALLNKPNALLYKSDARLYKSDEKVKISYNMYRKAKRGPNNGMIILGRVRLDEGAPLASEEDPYMDAIANESFGLTRYNMKEKTGSIMGLLTKDWSLLANDAWVLGGIHAEAEFHFASPFTKENLWNEKEGRLTLMGREAIYLLASGYQIRNRNPKLDDGKARMESLDNYPYRTYPYAVCVDIGKAQMASLPKFMNAVAQFHVKRKEGETQEEFKRRLETDENLKRRVTETKEALWDFFRSFSSVLEEDEGVVDESSYAMASP